MTDTIELVQATIRDLPIIQKIWPFYVYDLGRECVGIKNWEWPTDESFIPDDLTPFFNHPTKKPFLIKFKKELAGFAFVDKLEVMPEIDFYLSEFFILAKFQNKGIGKRAAIDLFNQLKGAWALGVIPENKKALVCWRKILATYTANHFSEFSKTSEELNTMEHPDPHPMIMFTFNSSNQNQL